MIACYVEDIEKDVLVIDGDSFTHLISGLRVKINEEVLALDGNGKKKKTKIEKIDKKKIILSGGKVESVRRQFNIDLLLSPPKRDALNDCFRMACEIGVRKIYLIETEYTQNKKFDELRIAKILKSSCVQSNNPFIPSVVKISDVSELKTNYEASFIFHLSNKGIKIEKKLTQTSECLIAIGPEGGFSERDICMLFQKLNDPQIICMSQPIMRTPTALCASLSWLLGKISIDASC